MRTSQSLHRCLTWGTYRYIPCCSVPESHTPPQKCGLFHWKPQWLSVCSASPGEEGKKTVTLYQTSEVCSKRCQTCDVWLNISYRRSYSLLFSLNWSCNILSCCPTASMSISMMACCVTNGNIQLLWLGAWLGLIFTIWSGALQVAKRLTARKCHFDGSHTACSVYLMWCWQLWTHLLVSWYWVQQPCVQFGIVLGQRPVLVILDEVHHRGEGQRLSEANPSSFVEDLYQPVGTIFPASV